MKRVQDGDVSVYGDGGQIPNGHATGDYYQEEAQQAPLSHSAQAGAHVEGEVEGQREADDEVGNGQRQDEHVGDDAAQSATEAQRQYGQRVPAEDDKDQQAIDDDPEDQVVSNGLDAIIRHIVN